MGFNRNVNTSAHRPPAARIPANPGIPPVGGLWEAVVGLLLMGFGLGFFLGVLVALRFGGKANRPVFPPPAAGSFAPERPSSRWELYTFPPRKEPDGSITPELAVPWEYRITNVRGEISHEK